jgi:hypothetical protein
MWETSTPPGWKCAASPPAARHGEAYTELYPNALNARSVSELLLLRSDVPRSLHACIEELSHILADLPGSYERTAQRLAAEFEARLRYTGIDEILEDGLHSRLTEFIETVRELAGRFIVLIWRWCDTPSYLYIYRFIQESGMPDLKKLDKACACRFSFIKNLDVRV